MLKLCRPCMAMPWNMVVQRIFGWFRCISERFYQNIPEPVPPNVGGFNTLPHPINTTSQTWPYGSCMEGMTLGLTTQDRQEETSANVALPKSWKCKSRHFESEKKTWISWIHSHSKPLDASDGSNWRLRAWIIWIWIWVSPGQIPPSTRIDHPITITSPLDFGAKRLAVRHPDILRSLRSLEALQYLQTRSKISKLYYPSGFIQPDLSWFNQKLFKSCTFLNVNVFHWGYSSTLKHEQIATAGSLLVLVIARGVSGLSASSALGETGGPFSMPWQNAMQTQSEVWALSASLESSSTSRWTHAPGSSL